MVNNLTCRISGYVDLRNLSTHNFCPDKTSAARSFRDLREMYHKMSLDTGSFGCPRPCNFSLYELAVGHAKVNTFIDPDNEYNMVGSQSYILALSYTILNIEEQTIVLLYDIGMLLSSMGGNVGLALGFSCLSMLLNLLEVIARY
jgi:Amiloride-sensitive sodium channel